MLSRRNFLAAAGATAGAAFLPFPAARAWPLGIPPGLQLWAVQTEMAKDAPGTLKALKAMGYARVEAAGWYGKSAADFRAMIADSGLECVSAHYGLRDLLDEAATAEKLAFAKEVGVAYVVASSPAPSRPMPQGRPWNNAVAEAMTLADWQSNAEVMNRVGRQAKALGLRFGYHNHAAEFLSYDGKVAFAEILRIADPALVTIELDIGWVAAAGADPAEVLKLAADRIQLLHVKDIATAERTPNKIVDDTRTTPIGSGTIDWDKVFRAAKAAPIQSYFVEVEPPFSPPALDSLAQSLAFMKKFG